MATFMSLPVELRLNIYEYVFPNETMQSLKDVGFRNQMIEASPTPNVTITLSTSALMQIYRSNPAGESRGRFWKPIPLLAVCKSVQAEAQHVWGRLPVTVGTWLSFLSNRPLHLLACIRDVHFHFWVTSRWSPQVPPTHQLDRWVATITQAWSECVERLQALMGGHLRNLSIDLTLMDPAIFTYRIRKGLSKSNLTLFNTNMAAAVETALVSFGDNGKWPGKELVVDGTEEYGDSIIIQA